MNPGYIEVTITRNALGVEEKSYTLAGGPLFYIDYNTLSREGFETRKDTIQVGPYKLRVIEFFGYEGRLLCTSENNPYFRLIVLWHKLSRVLRRINARLIITCAVWGLAEYRPECVPSWGQIYFIRWLRGIKK